MQDIRWGMIGCGDVTEVKSGPAFDKINGSSRVAVMSRTKERVQDYAARHAIPKWYTDASKLLNDPDVNAVYIATPPDSHLHYTRLAAAAGKPVYVEKPMALNYSECRQMIEACNSAGVPLFVAYYRRRLPKFLKVKELLEAGAIGEVRMVDIQLVWPPRADDMNPKALPWRVLPEIAGGGYFTDLAAHQLDLLDYYFGPIEEMSGAKANQAGLYPAEDAVAAHFRFRSGILGSGSWCFTVSASNQVDRTDIIGSAGTISYSCFDTDPVRLKTQKGMQEFSLPWPEHVHQSLLETVVAALQGQGQCPSTGESGARTNWAMDAVLNS